MMKIINENGKVFLKGPLSESDKKNRNSRVYPKDVLRESISSLISRVNAGGVYAYLEHPNHNDLIREDSCAEIVEVTWNEETGIAYCKVELLEDTTDGNIVIKRITNGDTVGISTRAVGSLDESGNVLPGLNIITADIISTGVQSCQVCRLEENFNTLSDFFITEKECECVFNKLSIKEKIEVRENVASSIINLFKGK